ncbi:P-loop containing nucleoside triphosphate hydrolase protein [Lipomyces arxii]|uniref:P-loop containing nucleoside triphosphate hydrolase protein n=1 Tax=Lipomyces arxii TaxID=56418 RepID=UPI0034CF3636
MSLSSSRKRRDDYDDRDRRHRGSSDRYRDDRPRERSSRDYRDRDYDRRRRDRSHERDRESRRDRDRERERDRHFDRDRDRDRREKEREDDRERERDRDRERERDRARERSSSPIVNGRNSQKNGDRDERERPSGRLNEPIEPMVKTKSTADVDMYDDNLEESDDEDVVSKSAPVENDAEIDPLDMFMSTLTEQTAEEITATVPSRGEIFDEDDDDPTVEAVDVDAEDMLALTSRPKKKKDLPIINHAKINYEPIRKQFYVEPQELADLTEEEVDEIRLELDGIKIRGLNCPKPVQKWSQFGLPAQTMDVIRKLGYDQPTSIQAQAIPAIMSGRDVIGVAKTGSGKTIAFLLPMFRHIKDQRKLDNGEGPIGLIMTPTRELAVQIHKECKPFIKALELRAVCAYGGSAIKEQIAELKRGAEIVVGTPGRIIDLLSANSGRVTNLKRVTYLTLDEADRMFDMGFEPQVMKILANIRPDRQTVLFSATFPKQMEALARKVLTKPVEIVVGARSVVADEITQIVEVRPEDTKFVRVLELLGDLYNKDEDARTLIFVERQEGADHLLKQLMTRGYPCMSIHGGKDQLDRDSAIVDFKNGVVPILIATSVAARGLDVKQLKLVINYDCPNHMEDYIHRVGRTGRAGNHGTAVTFVTPQQDHDAVDIAKALRLSKQPVPEPLQKLADSFMEKVKEGKERYSSGFGGKGLDKLDAARDVARRLERKAYGEDEEAIAEAVGEDDDDENPNMDDATRTALNAPIVVSRKTPTVSAPSAFDNRSALERAKMMSSQIDTKLKTTVTKAGAAPDNKGPDAGEFHATLVINDFPQKARWAVTNRTNIAKVLESTGTSITTKGNFYAAGKVPPPDGEPKLYILVEGQTEVDVSSAMHELKRLLAEAAASAAETETRSTGRYTVV